MAKRKATEAQAELLGMMVRGDVLIPCGSHYTLKVSNMIQHQLLVEAMLNWGWLARCDDPISWEITDAGREAYEEAARNGEAD